MVGSDGVLTGLIQHLMNAALSGEMNAHLKQERSAGVKNRQNGHTLKQLDTELGPVSISPPRDREGNFKPQLVGKLSRQLGAGLDRQILMMYAHGNSYGDIQAQLRQLYGLEYSTSSITEVTEQVWTEVHTWQQRTLERFYSVIFLDGIHFTTREGGKAVKKTVYSVYGIDAQGERDVLSIYIRDVEGAKDWGRVLEDLQRRDVEDVLFFCVDGLSGFSEAILEVFPQSFVQRCIVYMIRSSTRFVSDKHLKPACADLRVVYTATDQIYRRNWDWGLFGKNGTVNTRKLPNLGNRTGMN